MQSHQKKLKTAIRRTSMSASEHVATNASESLGLYQLEQLPKDQINRRILHPFSVHYSLPSSCWIATIFRHSDSYSDLNSRMRYSNYEFKTESEAKKFCKAYSPPKMLDPAEGCFVCKQSFNAKIRPCNCRNCGAPICEKCTMRWGSRMIPKTYVHPAYTPQTVRVCKSCDWLSNAFCMALLQGRYQDAVNIFETGNVNLRTCFAAIRGETMFPVHCCTLGGNLELLKWLVESQLCPVSVKRDPKTGKMLSLKTSSDRTLVDLAMVGKPKLDVLIYLVHKGISVMDLADPSLTGRTLEALLKSGILSGGSEPTVMNRILAVVDPSEGSLATVENACNLCCEKSMDCVLSPCGHQLCCSDCGKQLKICPMCKVPCSVLRIIAC